MPIRKILVTGSSGTIGTRLCERLLEEGYAVVGADWKPNMWSPRVHALTQEIDLRNKDEVLKTLPRDIHLIVHLAANARVYNLVVDPALARDNFETTFNVMEFARLRQVPRVIFSSSREVYGNTKKKRLRESDTQVDNCESPYTGSKIAGEALIRAYQKCYGIDFFIFRFSNVYGMYDSSERIVPLFIRLAKANKDLVIYGKEKTLDFTYIDDTVDGILLAITNFARVRNETANISFGSGTRLLKVATSIKKLLHSNSNIVLKENRTGEITHYVGDIRKAKKLLGYTPKVSVVEGLRKSVEWYGMHETSRV